MFSSLRMIIVCVCRVVKRAFIADIIVFGSCDLHFSSVLYTIRREIVTYLKMQQRCARSNASYSVATNTSRITDTVRRMERADFKNMSSSSMAPKSESALTHTHTQLM